MPASQYVSSSSTTPTLTSLHLALEAQRIRAKRHLSSTSKSAGPSAPPGEQVTRGPRVMVLGPPSSGKTTVVKNLVNMALSSGMGWSVGVAGLDPASVSAVTRGPGPNDAAVQSDPRIAVPIYADTPHPDASPSTSVRLTTGVCPTVNDVRRCWHTRMVVRALGTHDQRLGRVAQARDLHGRSLESPLRKGCEWSVLRKRATLTSAVMASGLIMDTSSAFVAATLGTKKDDPKARYSLVAHAIEAFQSGSHALSIQ